MAFGKKLSQNNEKYSPQPNNYCGGFAMSAILTDYTGTDTDPMVVYDEIQQFQKEIPASLTALIEKMKVIGEGTNICLPSSLVLFAKGKGLIAELAYSERLNFKPAEISAEIARCPEMTRRFADDNAVLAYFSGKGVAYCLILVDSCHWIAMKLKSDGKKFSVYDPETGEKTELADKGNLVQYLKRTYSNVGELIIMLNH